MKKIILLLYIILSFTFLSAFPVNAEQSKTQVVYFYVLGCSECEKAKPVIDKIENDYSSQIDLFRFDANDLQKGNKLFQKFLKEYNLRANSGVPLVYISDKALMGYSQISNDLNSYIDKCSSTYCNLKVDPNAEVENFSTTSVNCTGDKPCTIENDNLSIFIIITAALGDSINPCAIGVLIILITFLLNLKVKKSKLLIITFVYIFAVYITYFTAGLGLREIFSRVQIGKLLNYITAGFVLILGILSFYDAFNKKGKPILAIPDRAKPIIQRYISKASIPAALAAGFLVSAFELPCTGGIYLGITGLIGTQTTLIKGILYLLLYNLIFVSPLIIIAVLIITGKDAKKIKSLQKENKTVIKIIMGIVMFILAALLILL